MTLEAIQPDVTAYGSIAPFQPNKAILRYQDSEQAKILGN